MEPILNSQLPEFSVQAFHNGSFKTVTNNDVKGKWAIFFFYPADFTFVCPTELVDVAEKYDQLQAMGVEVYSVSCDSHFVHKAWHDASDSIRKIKYPMLALPICWQTLQALWHVLLVCTLNRKVWLIVVLS